VRLELTKTRIADLRIDYTLNEELNQVTGTATVQVEGHSSKPAMLTISKDKVVVFQKVAPLSMDSCNRIDFVIDNPELWSPHGYGEQHLYEFRAVVAVSGAPPLFERKNVGFRRAELVQESDIVGKSFYFRVNGYDVFCGGSDWIPADSFTPRVTVDRYRKWLQTMVDGHQTMIR
jgi:beta-mannosidase